MNPKAGISRTQKALNPVIGILLVMTAIPASSLAYPLEYDENANLAKDDEFEYVYDGANRLNEVRDLGGGLVARYAYDSGGNRISKELADGTITYYPFDDYEETHYANGTVEKTTYYFANGERVAKKVQVSGKADKTAYYHPDHLGSTSVVTGSSGQLVEKTKYYPFGAVLSGGSDRYGYTGQEKDPESDLMYYGARYYNPELMRFAQPDGLLPGIYDPQSLNRYSYVKNNPLKYIDPTGHDAVGDAKKAGDAAGFFRSLIDLFDAIRNEAKYGSWASSKHLSTAIVQAMSGADLYNPPNRYGTSTLSKIGSKVSSSAASGISKVSGALGGGGSAGASVVSKVGIAGKLVGKVLGPLSVVDAVLEGVVGWAQAEHGAEWRVRDEMRSLGAAEAAEVCPAAAMARTPRSEVYGHAPGRMYPMTTPQDRHIAITYDDWYSDEFDYACDRIYRQVEDLCKPRTEWPPVKRTMTYEEMAWRDGVAVCAYNS